MLKSELALSQTVSRLFHSVQFVKLGELFWIWILTPYATRKRKKKKWSPFAKAPFTMEKSYPGNYPGQKALTRPQSSSLPREAGARRDSERRLGTSQRPPTRACLGEPPFHTFPYKIRRTVYMRNKKLARLEGCFFDSRITLSINTWAHTAGSINSVKARQCGRVGPSAVVGKGVIKTLF